jgi:hypothetical protein
MPDIDSLEAAIEAAHKEAAVEVGPEPADDKAPAVSDVTVSDIPALSLELEATRNEPALRRQRRVRTVTKARMVPHGHSPGSRR